MLSTIFVDAEALRHNYRLFCDRNRSARVAPVLKANAYGHGLRQVYEALVPEDPAWLCVNYVDEARVLRSLGFRGRLLIVGPTPARQLAECTVLAAEPIIGNDDVLRGWLSMNSRPAAHVKFDTGMGRQGLAPADARAVADQLARVGGVAGVCTHFANVEDVTEQDYANAQLRKLETVVSAFKSAGLSFLVHASSSASALIMPDSHFDLQRIGISLYGVWPSQATRISFLQRMGRLIELQPVLTWRTEVSTVKPLSAGQYVGYGCSYRATRDMKIAVVPVGYFEGFPRLASNQGSFVLVGGARSGIVGRICMNMMMVDVTHVAGVAVGDQVTLIGRDGEEVVHAQDLGNWAQTIHYEILSRLHPDIPRRLTTSASRGVAVPAPSATSDGSSSL